MPPGAIPLSLMNYVFMITNYCVRIVTNYCVVLFTGNIIEIDGKYHLKIEQKEQDELRSEDIRDFGIEVVRFTNEQVLEKIDEVVKKLKEVIAGHTPSP